MLSIVRKNTWNCVENRRNCITNHNTSSSNNIIIHIIRSCCDQSTDSAIIRYLSRNRIISAQRQYRLCHSKKLYCILLYYEPPLLFAWRNYVNRCECSNKAFKNVMCIIIHRQVQRQRSRRRRRRHHLNTFCDNFKII